MRQTMRAGEQREGGGWRRPSLRLFLAMARRSWQRHLTYRAAAVAGLATNFFFGVVRASVLLALYGERQVVAGMTTQGLVTYAGLTQAVIAYLSLFGWYELMNTVYSGAVTTNLLKPIDIFSLEIAGDLSRATVALLLRGVTLMLLYALIFDLTTPASQPR